MHSIRHHPASVRTQIRHFRCGATGHGSDQDAAHSGYLGGRAKTHATFRSKLPHQPASSAGGVHDWRLSTRLRLRSRVVPVALDPVRGR
jgi:hypothetical protein